MEIPSKTSVSEPYAELRERLLDAHNQLLRQREELIDLRDERIRLQTELQTLREAPAAREQEIQGLQDEILKMRETKIWQLGTLYWRAHARLQGLLRKRL
jgi:chromosome segregation ATPase